MKKLLKQKLKHKNHYKWKENYYQMNFKEYVLLVELINQHNNQMKVL